MKIQELIPAAIGKESFKRSRERSIPNKTGCYALASISNVILYIGLTNDLRRRMNEHLDDPQKTKETANGRAVLFFWIETKDIEKVERTWMNIHVQHEGVLPILNGFYSPVSV